MTINMAFLLELPIWIQNRKFNFDNTFKLSFSLRKIKSLEQKEGKDTRENELEILSLSVYNWVLKILLISFG